MSSSSISFTFKLKAVYWDPGYDPSDPWYVNTPDAVQFDEHGYWYVAGEQDGRHKVGSKVAFVPDPFKYDYEQGYSDGAWKRLVMIQG